MILKIEATTRHSGVERRTINGGGPDGSGTGHIQSLAPVSRGAFPELAEEIGPLMEKHRHLVQVLDLVEVERFVDTYWRGPGRPQQSRRALARAFIATAIWNLPTTRDLIDRIEVDAPLRRLCGWPGVRSIPGEATFSRAFVGFSEARLAERMHEALV